MTNKKNLAVGFLNAGSLSTNQDEFIAAITDFRPDIVAINETWLRSGEESRAPRLVGYTLRHIPRSINIKGGRGGGVGFYIRKGIYARCCKYPTSDKVEQMWITTRIQNQTITIGTAYRPPWQDPGIFLDALSDSVAALHRNDGIILMGDFNINLLETNTSRFRLFRDFLNCFSLQQIITQPTHFTSRSSSLIDLICSDMPVGLVDVEHIPELGAHALLIAEFKIKKPKYQPTYRTLRPLKDIILDQFCCDLSSTDWESLEQCGSVSEMVESFTNCLIKIFDMHVPIINLKLKYPPHPWITETIRSMMRIRNKYHKKYKIKKTENTKESYKLMKSIVTKAIEEEKKSYFNKFINNNIGNSKKLWKNLKHTVLPNKNKTADLPSHLADPDAINNHFLTVPGDNQTNFSDLTYFVHHRHSSSTFSLSPVSEEVVLKAIMRINSNAQGHDGISLDMLQLTLPQTLRTIVAIVNRSITEGEFPSGWKTAIYLFIYLFCFFRKAYSDTF
ncbi:uncharacterized protein LOC123662705 [Melitaea cinxia]|uniref:uncharacterized protein LOC123662705 n=1 Tax=Melitaea cinxia TaxID=113334 RepID=UPI001E2729B9|nr:uncharacterized protein LOC123662705 [Melitaea cinxia]